MQVAIRLGRLSLSVRPADSAPEKRLLAEPAATATFASDVSPALSADLAPPAPVTRVHQGLVEHRRRQGFQILMVAQHLFRIASSSPPRFCIDPAGSRRWRRSRRPPPPAAPASIVLLEAGTGRVLTLPSAAANVFVADSKVAEVRPASASTLFVFGVGAGRTTVAALDADGGLVSQFDVTVQTSNFGAAQAQAEIARLVPRSHVNVRSLPTGADAHRVGGKPGRCGPGCRRGARRSRSKSKPSKTRSPSDPRCRSLCRSASSKCRARLSRKLGVNWQALGNIGQIGALPALIGTLNGAVDPLAGARLPFNAAG